MKNIFFLIFTILIGCKENHNSKIISEKEKAKNFEQEIRYGKKFFDYDQIDYYHIDTKENIIKELYENQDKSKISKYHYNVLIEETPENINDLDFLNYMEKIGYSKKPINPVQFTKIDKIFMEKSETESYAAACIPVFRDILVFRKNNKVTGVAKICFACHQYRIIGTDADTKTFGSNTDYIQLANILELKNYNYSE